MAISKRVRYEVLRRDGHACRYCGATAPEVKLHIDHVVPVSLGGDDKPSNLVTSCEACNLGKTSTTADEPVVEDVNEAALRWAAAMRAAAATISAQTVIERGLFDEFERRWEARTFTYKGQDVPLNGPLPDNWQRPLKELYEAGLPLEVINEAADIVSTLRWQPRDPFAYCIGILNNKLREQAAVAQQMLKNGEV